MKHSILRKQRWNLRHSMMDAADGGFRWFHAGKMILKKWMERSDDVIVFGKRWENVYQTEKRSRQKKLFLVTVKMDD